MWSIILVYWSTSSAITINSFLFRRKKTPLLRTDVLFEIPANDPRFSQPLDGP